MRVLRELKLTISVARVESPIQFLRFNKTKPNRLVIKGESPFIKVLSICSSIKSPIKNSNSGKNSRPQLKRTKLFKHLQVVANEKLLKTTLHI